MRYTQDGDVDYEFGMDGFVSTRFGEGSGRAEDIAVGADGKIVVVGQADWGELEIFAVARFNTDGTPDASFGLGGKDTLDVSGPGSVSRASAVAIQPDGKIILAGYGGPESQGFALARYEPVHAGFCAGDVLLETQQQVSEFACTAVEGDLMIMGDEGMLGREIHSLDALSGLIRVGGSFGITNTSVTSLTGLSGLTTIGGSVFIEGNGSLTSFTGTESLISVGGDFSIQNNVSLTSLTGLEALVAIGNDLVIANNAALTSLSGLSNLSTLTLDLHISNNASLATLAGLSADLTAIGGHLYIGENPVLTTLSGLPSGLNSVGENLSITGNVSLVDCACALKPLTTAAGGSYSFTGVGGSISINSNGDAICSSAAAVLQALPTSSCTNGEACSDPRTAPFYAGGYVLNQAGSRAFVRVTVPTGGKTFEFYNTHNLVVGAPEAGVEGGALLSGVIRTGNTFSFAAASPGEVYFPITTAGSGTGVSFYLRVTDTCGRTVDVDPAFTLTGVEEVDALAFALEASQPNPVRERAEVHFSLEKAGEASLVLYDVLGREVAVLAGGQMEAGAHTASVDASSLPSGVYVYRLSSQGRTLVSTLTVAR